MHFQKGPRFVDDGFGQEHIVFILGGAPQRNFPQSPNSCCDINL